jgi:spore germination protein YaaH
MSTHRIPQAPLPRALLHAGPSPRAGCARQQAGRHLVFILVAALGLATAAVAQPSPHQRALERHRDHPVLNELVGHGGRPSILRLPLARPTTARRVVFGYLPYWIDADYYQNLDFSLLTHISAFSVEINPDGTIGHDHGWPWTALVERAHAQGVRVVLTATLFGDDQVLTLIADEAHRQTFFRQIRQRLIEGSADGLNVDFEGPGANGWPSLIADFMADLTAYLHREIPGSEVSFAAPAVDWGGRWDHQALANSCDYLFIMGYSFSGSWSETSGPTAPLTGGWRNITTTVTGADDFGEVARQSPEKLILGVPYYGCLWQTDGPKAGSRAAAFIQYPRLLETLPWAATHGRAWDKTSSTPWYTYEVDGQWHQVWYDDPVSLGLKYDLALESNLLGVGMWALGYEGDRHEPWDLLATKIGRGTPATAVLEPYQETTPEGFELDQNYPNPFNNGTVIRFALPKINDTALTIYNLAGQKVATLIDGQRQAGIYTVRWDGRDDDGHPLASGVYLYRLQAEAQVQTRRLVLVR